MLVAMFPDLDKDVMAAVLADVGNVESAIEALLEMTGQGGGAGGPAPPPQGATINEDEELAKSMFMQFAAELEQELKVKVPDEVRADPELYQAFMASALAEHEAKGRSGGSGGVGVDGLAARVFQSNSAAKSGGGVASFMDRFRGKAKTTPMMSSTRVKVIAVGDDKQEGMRAGLLDNAEKI